MSRSVCVYHSRGLVRSLPGEAILPQSECRTRCVLWTLYHKAGRKGSAARGKRKKICLFRQTGLYIPCGGISALSGLPWARHLPQGGRQVSPSCRGVAGLFHVKHAWLALSCGWNERLPSPGFAGLFHVKRGLACLKLWAGKSACPLRLAYGKPPPPEGEASFRALHGLTGLFHVNHAWLALNCGREKERLPSPACHGQATSPKGGGKFLHPAVGLLVCFT